MLEAHNGMVVLFIISAQCRAECLGTCVYVCMCVRGADEAFGV